VLPVVACAGLPRASIAGVRKRSLPGAVTRVVTDRPAHALALKSAFGESGGASGAKASAPSHWIPAHVNAAMHDEFVILDLLEQHVRKRLHQRPTQVTVDLRMDLREPFHHGMR